MPQSAQPPAGWPAFDERIELTDGTEVHLRPVLPDDAEGLRQLFYRLSPESVYLRFLDTRKHISLAQAQAFATVDYQQSMAIVALVEAAPEAGQIVAVARYVVGDSPGWAEAAVVVEDRLQGHGLGTQLLLRLLAYARSVGIDGFLATVHPTNNRVLHFVEKSGLPSERHFVDGLWEIRLSLSAQDGRAGVETKSG